MIATKDIRRALAISLALSLTLPSPALALRDQEVAEKKPEVLSGLEEALRGDPTRLATTLGLPSTAPAHTTPNAVTSYLTAGMEERSAVRKWGLRILLGTAVGAGAWMVANEIFGPRPEAPVQQQVEKAEIDPNLLKHLRADLRGKVAPGTGLYLWEFPAEVSAEEMKRYLPRLLDYVKQHRIRKVYVSLLTTDQQTVEDRVLSDARRFEKQLAQWKPLFSELKEAGVQVWLTYHASWWGNPDHAWKGLNSEERGTVRQLPRDVARFAKDPEYAARYDLDYAVPVHTRYHLKALKRIANNADFKKVFQGLYVHLEPYWTVGWTDKAGQEVVNRYLERYLRFLEEAHRITTEAKLPMMVNSWQGALEVPAGIHSGIGTPDLVRWQGKPLLEAVQQRAEIVNVWIQGVEPTVSTGKLNTLLTAQNPELPLEITLELFDQPDRDLVVKHPNWPEQLWGIAGEISQRWPNGPFSITIRGDRGGQTAAPAVRPKQADAPKKAGMEESIEEVLQQIEQRFSGDQQIMETIKDGRTYLQRVPDDLKQEVERWPFLIKRKQRLLQFLNLNFPKVLVPAEVSLMMMELDRITLVISKSALVPGTSIRVLWFDPPSDKSADLAYIAEALRLLKEVSQRHHQQVETYVQFIQVGYGTEARSTNDNLKAFVTESEPGLIRLRQVFETYMLRHEDRVHDLLETFAEEVDHMRFHAQWGKTTNTLVADKLFEFETSKQSLLTDHRDPYSYLLEVDGQFAVTESLLHVAASLTDSFERKAGFFSIKKHLGYVAETLAHLKSLDKGILTERGADLVAEQTGRWALLYARYELMVGKIKTVSVFEFMEGFLATYGDLLRKQDLLETAQVLAEQSDHVTTIEGASAPESPVRVTAYTPSAWEKAVDAQLKRGSLPSVSFAAASYPVDGRVEQLAVVIREAGAVLPAEPNPAVPVIVLLNPSDIENLTPGFVYAVAVNKNLAGQVIGPIVGILTFTDEQGRTIHAIFA